MAMNPMQRKVKNAFLLGIVAAIFVAAIVVGILFIKIKGLNEEIETMREKEKIAMTQVYTVSEEVKAGESVRYLTSMSIAVEKAPKNAITDENLNNYAETNSKGELILDENGNPTYQMKALVGITPNTIMTTDMVEKSAEAGTFRMVECTSLVLPSKLATGDYIDIRLKVYTSHDFIVLSKIKVEDSTANTIWLKLSESEAMMLRNAMLETYMLPASQLYAQQFVNEAQAPLRSTYVPSEAVKNLIEVNKLTEQDEDIIREFYNDTSDPNNNTVLHARQLIESLLPELDERESKAQDGFTQEKTAIQATREDLLGEMGY